MARKAGNSAKAERDLLRERMRGYGCAVAQIAVEMARRFGLRPRVASRHALGWPQWKLAQRYNTLHPGARLSDNRISEFECWPHGGSPPSPPTHRALRRTGPAGPLGGDRGGRGIRPVPALERRHQRR